MDNFLGVYFNRSRGRWTACLRVPADGKKLYIGSYATAPEAMRAYDKASLKHYGRAAVLNGDRTHYLGDIREMDRLTTKEYMDLLRKQSRKSNPVRVQRLTTLSRSSDPTESGNSNPVGVERVTTLSGSSNLTESGNSNPVSVEGMTSNLFGGQTGRRPSQIRLFGCNIQIPTEDTEKLPTRLPNPKPPLAPHGRPTSPTQSGELAGIKINPKNAEWLLGAALEKSHAAFRARLQEAESKLSKVYAERDYWKSLYRIKTNEQELGIGSDTMDNV